MPSPFILALNLIALLLAGPEGPPAPRLAPSWLGRCLGQLRATALAQGSPLPFDSPPTRTRAQAQSQMIDFGTCAARCDDRCFLMGDFDGDGRPRELAVAGPTEVLFFHEVERRRDRRYYAVPAGRIPLSGDEVALVSPQRTERFAAEVGLLRDGKSPLPPLRKGEHLALGLIIWHHAAPAKPPPDGGDADNDDDDDDEPHGGETGDLMLVLFDEGTGAYRLQPVLQLGGGAPGL